MLAPYECRVRESVILQDPSSQRLHCLDSDNLLQSVHFCAFLVSFNNTGGSNSCLQGVHENAWEFLTCPPMFYGDCPSVPFVRDCVLALKIGVSYDTNLQRKNASNLILEPTKRWALFRAAWPFAISALPRSLFLEPNATYWLGHFQDWEAFFKNIGNLHGWWAFLASKSVSRGSKGVLCDNLAIFKI